jgi:integrase
VRIGDTTRSDYLITLECFVLPYFGMRKAESLTRLNIEQFRSDMSEGLPGACRLAREAKLKELQTKDPNARLKPLKNPGARTINKCLGVLVSALRYGKKIRMLSENVAEGIEKLPVVEGEERCIEKNVLTPAELLGAIQHAVDPFRIPIAMGAYTGLRQEEILGLKWSDFSHDFTTAQIKRVYRLRRFAKPKTTSSLRTIEIPRELGTMLKQWRQRCPENEHGVVCPSTRGLLMHASALLQRGFLPALERAGVRRVRFHDLRHSFASNLLGAGVDVVTVSKALGHANVQITLMTYAHAVPKPRHGATDRMAALLHQDDPNSAGSGKDGVDERPTTAIAPMIGLSRVDHSGSLA